jgi:hypothetical protein
MTTHMFRLVVEQPDGVTEQEANSIVDDWLANNTPWTDDPIDHSVFVVDDPLTDAPNHFRGDLRFEFSDAKTDLLSQMETDLQEVVSWYRIGYHECDHDEANANPCSWDNQIEYGTVPDGLPTFV